MRYWGEEIPIDETMDAERRFYVIDVGNKTVHAGIADAARIIDHRKIPSSPEGLDEGLGGLQGSNPGVDIDGAIIASVVPSLNPFLEQLCRERLSVVPVFLNHETDAGIRIDYADPSEVGADRIANAAAACNLYGCPATVVDFGTAITFDIVSGDCVYLGGVIAPGLDMASEALSEGTALLPRVERWKPVSVIGKSTEDAIRAGIYFGACGLIERVIKELGESGLEGCIVFTGGGSKMVAEAIDCDVIVNPLLTLEGLRIIYSRIVHE